jgi:hypothetical protein
MLMLILGLLLGRTASSGCSTSRSRGRRMRKALQKQQQQQGEWGMLTPLLQQQQLSLMWMQEAMLT